MTYNKQFWENHPSTTTPLSAQRLNHLETQYEEAVKYVDAELGNLPNWTTSPTPGTLLIRGPGGVLPGVGTPLGASDASNKGYVDGLFQSVISGGFPRSSVRHVEKSGYSYEVVRVSGGFGAIQKIQSKEVSSDGSMPLGGLPTPKQISAETGVQSLTNCDANIVSGGRHLPVGLQIIDGQPIQNFGVTSGALTGSDREALLLMRDGSLQPARIQDGLTAAEYVSAGAYASFGYGPILVENGVAPTWWTDPAFSGFATQLSARLILGQSDDGDYILITVDGRSGDFGITGQQISQIAIDEGCHIAVNLDGGGTTQLMWRGNLVHPSTDASGIRGSLSYIAINAPTENEYDSGEIPLATPPDVTAPAGVSPVSVRQLGSEIFVTFRLSSTFPTGEWKALTSSGVPVRYRGFSDREMKGIGYGVSGIPVGISAASGTFVLNGRAEIPGTSSSGLLGRISYQGGLT